MKRKWLAGIAVVVLSTLFFGCPKKEPVTPPEDLSTRSVSTAPANPATDVKPSAKPASGEDRTQVDPLKDPDLAKLNSYVWNQGLLGDVYFDFDRYELKSEFRDRLSRNADWLKSHPEFLITIEGHCDERGTNEYNLALGQRRATAARDYIVSLGVAATRIRTISYGEERPVCNESGESCWSQNRRAHFLISSRGGIG